MKGIKNKNDGKKSLHGIRRNGKTPSRHVLYKVVSTPGIRQKKLLSVIPVYDFPGKTVVINRRLKLSIKCGIRRIEAVLSIQQQQQHQSNFYNIRKFPLKFIHTSHELTSKTDMPKHKKYDFHLSNHNNLPNAIYSSTSQTNCTRDPTLFNFIINCTST